MNETIKDILTTCLSSMGIAIDRIDVIERGSCATFVVHSKDAALIIGTRGEHLDALRHVIRRMVERGYEGDRLPPFIIDVNNYHSRKLQGLLDSAELSARRAKLFRQNVELPPMNSYERMLIHNFFADDEELKTESEGEGPFRHVVLKYHASSVEA